MPGSVVTFALVAGTMLAGTVLADTPEGGDPTPPGTRLERGLQEGGLKGQFVERTPGSYVLVPESRDLPAVKVLNPEQVAPASVGVDLVVRATYDAQKHGVLVQDYRLPGVRDVRLPETPAPAARAAMAPTRSAARALTKFRGDVSRALKPGAMSADILSPGDDSSVTRAAQAAEDDLDSLYRDAVRRGDAGMTDRRNAVRALAEVRQELKAIYGTYDNYPPWSYDRIFSNARSVVAIAEPGRTQALCSGVLIAGDLVLTAGHCFRSHHPKDLEIWFGFAETADRRLPEPITRRISELVAPAADRHDDFLARAADDRFDADMPDFAVVRFERDTQTAPPAVTPQCLRKHHVPRGRALYVIGYPKGTPETVHDNGRVYLPFRLRPREFEDLKRDIEVDFALLEDEERIRLLDEFVASYVSSGEGADRVFELYDTRWGNQPKLGIVADLFRGNSGSPVYDRENHCVVGIHTGGASDTGQRLGASWQTHETVLPIPAVLADLGGDPRTAPLLDGGVLTIR